MAPEGGAGGPGGPDEPRGPGPGREEPPPSQGEPEEGLAPEERRLAVKVGAFVVALVAAAVMIVVLLGQKTHLFRARVVVHAAFSDVQGLKEGAPVWLSGVNVGLVSRIAFATDRGRPFVRVDLEVSRDALGRMRADSVARIGAQGLLGDRIVDLTVGTPSARRLAPGDWVQTVPGPDLNRLVQQAADAVRQAQHAAEIAAGALDQLANPQTISDVQRAASSLRALLRQAERGPGLAHALFYDPAQAQALEHMVERVDALVAHTDVAVRHIDALVASTGTDGRQLLDNVSRAARDVGAVAAELRGSEAIPQLGRAARDLADLVAYAKAGQGTIGALVTDPTVYEQLVSVLGGVGRSRLLRALVRYSIARDTDHSAGRQTIGGTPAPGGAPRAVPPPPPSGQVPTRSPGGRVPSLPPNAPPAPAR